jgi:hypothetical protein
MEKVGQNVLKARGHKRYESENVKILTLSILIRIQTKDFFIKKLKVEKKYYEIVLRFYLGLHKGLKALALQREHPALKNIKFNFSPPI